MPRWASKISENSTMAGRLHCETLIQRMKCNGQDGCASEFKDKTQSIIKVGNALEKLTFCLAKRAEKNAALPRCDHRFGCDCITKFIFAITVRKQLYLQM